MKTRIVVGAILVAVFVCMMVFGGYVFAAALAFFAFVAVFEMGRAFREKGYEPFLIPAYVYAVLFPFANLLIGESVLLPLMLLAMMAVMIRFLFSEDRDVLKLLPSIAVLAYPLAFLTVLAPVYELKAYTDIGFSAALLAFAAPETADAFAYFGGTFFGKKKLWPELSPKKTVAGSISSVIGGALFGFLLLLLQKLWGGSVSGWLLVPMGLLAGISAQFGDLFASSVKRWAGIKDFSTLFPGHGGVLDRIDSILFTAPPVYFAFLLRILLNAHC